MTTTIDIYPPCPRPKWIKVGAKVEVIGEGGIPFRITAIEDGRAAVIPSANYYKGHRGGDWESFTKLYRTGRFEDDYSETHPQLPLFSSPVTVPKTGTTQPKLGSLKSTKLRKKSPKYTYSLMTVADARDKDWVYLPNCLVEDTVQIWRYLTKRRTDFPEFSDNGTLVSDVMEAEWQRPKVYSFGSLDDLCIVRSVVR